ncbi:MAG: ComF family protein [Pseudomonadota bacterium]
MAQGDAIAPVAQSVCLTQVIAPKIDAMFTALLSHMAPPVARGARRLLDAVLPPQCPVTGEAVRDPGVLSAAGWSKLQFIDDPACASCGAPFAYDHGDGAMCGACIANRPAFDSARAALLYDDASHKLIVAFKHADRTEYAPMFGAWLARRAAATTPDGAVLVPVPLHPRRLAARRYNQSALIAGHAAKLLDRRHEPQVLIRRRATPPQQQLSEAARKRNVAGAFAVDEERCDLIRDRHIILVDDVLTTGATLSACARALKSAGAARVDALVLARVARGGAVAI